MRDIDEDFVRSAFAETGDPTAVLITLNGGGMPEPIRVSSDPDGVTSNGVDFVHFPFSFTGAGSAGDEIAKQARLEIGNVDGRIGQQVRLAESRLTIDVDVVRLADPDTIDRLLEGAEITDIEIDDPKITGTIKPREFSSEPACAARYTIFRTPGLFTNTLGRADGTPTTPPPTPGGGGGGSTAPTLDFTATANSGYLALL